VNEGTFALFGNDVRNGQFYSIIRSKEQKWNRNGLKLTYDTYLNDGSVNGGVILATPVERI